MIVPDNLCLGCMHHMTSDNGICEHCGFELKKYNANPRWLKPGTIIGGKYIVGKVLGEGGFGITYIGWNSLIEMPVAIKEYFPQSSSARDLTTTKLSVFLSEKELFEDGMKKLLNEARTMSKMESCSGIVSIYDYFNENNTAYIIMEYVDGSSMKEFIKKDGPMPYKQVLEITKPIMEDLEKMHSLNLIHRDVSPDNIMIRNDGQIKLIDFGAARLVEEDEEKSFTVMLKRGYTPEEQYRSRGEQGPWTDVYALCATLYYMITGDNIPEAMQRVISDTYTSISEAGFPIDEKTAAAIDKGLAVKYTDRIQSMSELMEMLYGDAEGLTVSKSGKLFLFTKGNPKKKSIIIGLISFAVVIVPVLIMFRAMNGSSNESLSDVATVESADIGSNTGSVAETPDQPEPDESKLTENESAVPESASKDEARVSAVPATPTPTEISPDAFFATVPNVTGKSLKAAGKKLKKAELDYSITKEYNNDVKKGYVIAQNIDKGTKVAPGTVIRLTISKGKPPVTPTPKPYSNPSSGNGPKQTTKPSGGDSSSGSKGSGGNIKAIEDNDNDDELAPVTGI